MGAHSRQMGPANRNQAHENNLGPTVNSLVKNKWLTKNVANIQIGVPGKSPGPD